MDDWNNQAIKANTINDIADLLNRLECKIALLDAADRDVTSNDCMDLNDQLTTMLRSMDCLTAAIKRARAVNGVEEMF